MSFVRTFSSSAEIYLSPSTGGYLLVKSPLLVAAYSTVANSGFDLMCSQNPFRLIDTTVPSKFGAVALNSSVA